MRYFMYSAVPYAVVHVQCSAACGTTLLYCRWYYHAVPHNVLQYGTLGGTTMRYRMRYNLYSAVTHAVLQYVTVDRTTMRYRMRYYMYSARPHAVLQYSIVGCITGRYSMYY